MTDINMVTSAQLRAIVKKIEGNWQLISSRTLSGGMSAEVMLLEVINSQGDIRRWLLRWHISRPERVDREYRLQTLLHKNDLPVAKPVLLDTSSEIIEPAYIVLDYIDGQAVYATPESPAFLQQYVDTLVKIHRVTQSDTFNFLPDRTAQYNDIITHIPEKMDISLREDEIRAALRAAWRWQPIHQPVLLHGDYWAGNLIWRDDTLQAVIDWEDAAIGDPLIDLAYCRLEILFAFGKQAMEQITRLYQAKMPQLNYVTLPYWDLCSALRFMNTLDQMGDGWVDFGRPDVTGQTMRHAHQWYVSHALANLPE